ncbi:MAG: folate family ECF transporter S component [Oscillospiraceae bacterium]|jgi:ECF transporter S component (folate family)|nr:folate family ECF transporter S component [Oscillospiraceae bacterium]
MRSSLKKFFSVKDVFKARNLTVMAILLAMRAILSQFDIYVSASFRALSFAELPGALAAILYGPWAGLAFALLGDFFGYIVKPVGPYFPLFAVGEMLANFIYACFLYKREIKTLNVIFARLLIFATVSMGVNFISLSLLYGQTAGVFFTQARFVSNAIQLPIHVFLVCFFGRFAVKAQAGRKAADSSAGR